MPGPGLAAAVSHVWAGWDWTERGAFLPRGPGIGQGAVTVA